MEKQSRSPTTDAAERLADNTAVEKMEDTEGEGNGPTTTTDTPSVVDEEEDAADTAVAITENGETTTSASASTSSIPNGGLQAWLQVAGAWVILLDSWGLINTFGVYQTYYETTLLRTHSSSDISWIGSLQASLLFLVGVVGGPLYDAGHARAMMLAGLFLMLLGQFMLSLCTSYWQVLLAQGICTSLGMGLAFLPATAIQSQYFTGGKRSLVLGIAFTGSPIGGIVFPVLFSSLQPRVGFGWATRIIGFVMLALSAVPAAFMRTRLPAPGKVRALFDPEALRDGPYLFFMLAACCSFLVVYVPFFYIQLYALTRGDGAVSPDFAPYLVTLLNVGNTVGRVLPNELTRHFGGLNVMLACTVTSTALAFAWMGIRSRAGLCAFAVLYGLFSGGVISLNPSIAVELTPDLSRVGARMAVMFLFAGVAVLIGNPIAGDILGGFSQAEWFGTIGFVGAGLSAATCFVIVARILLYRRNGKLRS